MSFEFDCIVYIRLHLRHSQVRSDDDSAQSILSYAIDFVGVEHGQSSFSPGPYRTISQPLYLFLVVVVGHSQCGGAAACLSAVQSPPSATPDTPLTRWLTPLTALASSIHNRQPPPSTSEEALSILVEENVKAQVQNVCKAPPVAAAWAGAMPKSLWVHGWVFEMENGRLRDLGVSKGPPAIDSVDSIEAL